MKKLDENFWEKYFRVYDVLNAVIPYQELLDELEKELGLSQEDIVLDVGSGTGNLMVRLKSKCKKIIGLDFSDEGIKAHKDKDQDAEAILFDITQKFPFDDDYFSKVVSNNVIYTLDGEQQNKTLTEILRVLKPGGKFVISNVKKGFSPIKIYTDHIAKSIKKAGFLKTISSFFILFVPTLKMFYYNKKIKNSGGAKHYNFLKVGEQKRMLENLGFVKISEEKLVYSGQAVMNNCYKA